VVGSFFEVAVSPPRDLDQNLCLSNGETLFFSFPSLIALPENKTGVSLQKSPFSYWTKVLPPRTFPPIPVQVPLFSSLEAVPSFFPFAVSRVARSSVFVETNAGPFLDTGNRPPPIADP